jgi:hypothetical protein
VLAMTSVVINQPLRDVSINASAMTLFLVVKAVHGNMWN